MEELVSVNPKGTDFRMSVAKRHEAWYSEAGYEPLSSGVFERAAALSDTIIDIGAHVGWYSIMGARANPLAEVIAVEGDGETAEVCRRNCDLVVPGRVDVRSAVFAAESGEVEFHITEASDNNSISGHPQSRTVEIAQRPAISGQDLGIDDGRRLLIKVDVEGHELSALTGLTSLIRGAETTRLILELNPACLALAGYSSDVLVSWLRQEGFQLFLLDDHSGRWRSIADDVRPGDLVGADSYANLYAVRGVDTIGVALVLHSGALGGAEKTALAQARSLMVRGHLVHAYVPELAGGLASAFSDNGVSVSLHTGRWWVALGDDHDWAESCPGVEKLVVDLEEHPASVVMTVTGVIPAGAVAAHLCGIPHVWSLHEFMDLDHQLRGRASIDQLGAFISRYSQAVVANSRAVGEHVLGPDVEFTIVPPIVRNEVPQKRAVRSHPQSGVLGVFSGFQPNKGHADLLAALTILRREGRKVTLRIFGTGSAEDRRRLLELVRDMDLTDAVSFEGWVADPQAAMASVDIVVMPSHREAFGRIPIEAVFAGTPVVYSRGGGMDDYMVNGVTGVECSPGDPEDLSRAVRSLLDDQRLRDTIAEKGPVVLDGWLSDRSPEDVLLSVLVAVGRPQAHDWAVRAMTRLVAFAAQEAVARESRLNTQLETVNTQLETVRGHAEDLYLSLRELRDAHFELNQELLRRSEALDVTRAELEATREVLGAIQSTRRYRATFGWKGRLSHLSGG